nr:hypothetical protein DKFZp564D166.1 - human [Homo sapiens]
MFKRRFVGVRPICFHCTFSGLVSTFEVVLWLNFSCSFCVVFRGGSPHAEILCMQPTGKRPPGSQDFSFSCLCPATCSLPLFRCQRGDFRAVCFNPGRSDTLVSFFQETIAFTDVLVV